MKLTVLILLGAIGAAYAGDIEFDPANPSLLSPGKTSCFEIQPAKNEPKATIRLWAEETKDFKTSEGMMYAPVEKITVQQGNKSYEIPYEYTDIGVPHIDVADFDGDEDMDFRVITAWGTGGSWYCYYRYQDGQYERWVEPEELGLNGQAGEGTMHATGRSGPESSSAEYQFKNGHFRKVRTETIRLKESLPELEGNPLSPLSDLLNDALKDATPKANS